MFGFLALRVIRVQSVACLLLSCLRAGLLRCILHATYALAHLCSLFWGRFRLAGLSAQCSPWGHAFPVASRCNVWACRRIRLAGTVYLANEPACQALLEVSPGVIMGRALVLIGGG
jgi:hypothetical protein